MGDGVFIADTRPFNPAALKRSAFAHMMRQSHPNNESIKALQDSAAAGTTIEVHIYRARSQCRFVLPLIHFIP
jgi:hypothetical protein